MALCMSRRRCLAKFFDLTLGYLPSSSREAISKARKEHGT
jgi:hypothetical protein